MAANEKPGSSDETPVSAVPRMDYSTAYSDIIGENDDLISMIAYCLYKKQKRQFIIKHQLAFNDPRVRRYHDDLNEDRVSTLRVTAESRLRAYADTIQDAVLADVGEEIRNGTIIKEIGDRLNSSERHLKETIKRETVWWKVVIYSVIGGFALGLIIVAASWMGFMNPFEALPSSKPVSVQRETPPAHRP